MGNTIKLLSISELLGMNFYIPSYQRGYRWTKQQVEDLLNDVYGFALKKKNDSGKEFYCLQPIIAMARIWDNKNNDGSVTTINGWEIVDGQQRLTTLRIMLSYFIKKHLREDETLQSEYGKDVFTINYETRENTEVFLAEIVDNNNENIDFYHISNAYKYIAAWFEKHERPKMVRDSILNTLVLDERSKKSEGLVKVIWYEISNHPIETFIRINLGKISLTNAELIKALFLQERNFGEGDIAKLKQLEIAQDWDRIENELQDENFWWFLNKEQNKTSSHIEFIFDMMCASALKKDSLLKETVGEDHYQTFRFFNHKIGDTPNQTIIKDLWEEVTFLFQTFKEWYSNPEWYHYIGFLINCGKTVQDIIDLLRQSFIVVKADVTDVLIVEIKKQFKLIGWENNSDKEDLHLDLSYESDKGLLRKFFLLFNLEYIIQQSNHQNLIYKFPFKAFKIQKKEEKLMSWDIEHISSVTDNSLEKFEDQKVWLENALQDIAGISEDLELEINAFLGSENSGVFENLYKKVFESTNEDKIREDLKNSIGNLTLLDAGTNRGYGNALFASKRRIIIEKDKQGQFIPLCTKNVFLKYFDGNTQSKWIEADIIGYRSVLEKVMSKFVQNKTVDNEK